MARSFSPAKPARTLILFLAAGLTMVAGAALTPEQVATALGSPAGQTWTIVNPEASGWKADATGLHLSDSHTDSVHAVQATMEGPGVASVALTYISQGYDLAVYIDGVQHGVKNHSNSWWWAQSFEPRVEIGKGIHTVKWELSRTDVAFSGPLPLTVNSAKWTPFHLLPLSAESTGSGITFSSSGLNPWKGQDAWSYEDGNALWSGVRPNRGNDEVTTPDAPLQASFSGPGILRYRHKGTNLAGIRIDGGSVEHLDWAEEKWHLHWKRVGEGAHVVEWITPAWLTDPNERITSELFLDEVILEPDLPLATGLETPGWNWTARGFGDSPAMAAVLSEIGEPGGHYVSIGRNTNIVTRIKGPGIMTIRCRKVGPRVVFHKKWGDDDLAEIISKPGSFHENEWSDLKWRLPAATGDFWITNETEIDRIEFQAWPDLDELMGVPVGTVYSGGGKGWKAMPFAGGGEGAGVEVPDMEPYSAMEMKVEGPAAVDFKWQSDGPPGTARVLVDDRQVSVLKDSGRSRLEFSYGSHVIRWEAGGSRDAGDPASLVIGEVKVTRLKELAEPVMAAGRRIPFLAHGDWKPSFEPGRGTGTVLKGPAAMPESPSGDKETIVLGAAPGSGGILSFWWYQDKDSPVVRWELRDQATGAVLLVRDGSTGWKKGEIRVPPGIEFVEWVLISNGADRGRCALDEVAFKPDEGKPYLAEALDAKDLKWTNDPVRRWTRLVLPGIAGDVAMSPPMSYGESSGFSTEVTGPGMVSFRWGLLEPGGVKGEFKVNGIILRRTYSEKEEHVEIPVCSKVKLEWTVTVRAGRQIVDKVFGVDQVKWKKFQSVPLGKALDTAANVQWRTSKNSPFVGRPLEGARNGTAAYIGLMPRDASWLEATVTGPGLFDFWIHQAVDDLSEYLWDFWEVELDGKRVWFSGTSWPALEIKGEGKHRIRFTFRNPEYMKYHLSKAWGRSSIDNVSWMPGRRLAAGKRALSLPFEKWKGTKSAVSAAPRAGVDSDGDGASDLVERAFLSDPSSRASRPPGLRVETGVGPDGNRHNLLRIPWLSIGFSGVLQSSPDMFLWEDEPIELEHQEEKARGLAGENGNDGYTIPLPAGDRTRFYRIWITSEPDAE